MRLRIEQFELDLNTEFTTASQTVTTRKGAVIIVTDGETYGIGEATPLAGWTESTEACYRALSALPNSLGDHDIDGLLHQLSDTPAARHGVELALLDYAARKESVPLYTHISDSKLTQTSVPVNATIGSVDGQKLSQQVESAINQGYETIKVKAGKASPDVDKNRIERVRSIAGPSVSIRVDVNESWNLRTAQAATHWINKADVEYLEQPLPRECLEEHAELNRSANVAIDEGLYEYDITSIIEKNAAAYLICKPMAIGGILPTRKIARQARNAGIEPVITTTIDGAIARTAATHLAVSLAPLPACGLATGQLLAEDHCRFPIHVDSGVFTVPDAVGLGIDRSEL